MLLSFPIILTCLAPKNICIFGACLHLSIRLGKYRAEKDGVLLRHWGSTVCWIYFLWLLFVKFWVWNACGIRNNVWGRCKRETLLSLLDISDSGWLDALGWGGCLRGHRTVESLSIMNCESFEEKDSPSYLLCAGDHKREQGLNLTFFWDCIK